MSWLRDWLLERERGKQMEQWRRSVDLAETMMLRMARVIRPPVTQIEAQTWFLMYVRALREMPGHTLAGPEAERVADEALQRLGALSAKDPP